MCDLRKKFTENAEQFDALMVEMLEENDKLKNKNEALIKECAIEFFTHWFNTPGGNTDKGFDDWWKINKKRFGSST